MWGTILSHCNALLLMFCAYEICHYLNKKPLGMQTLYDATLCQALTYLVIWIWFFLLLPLDTSMLLRGQKIPKLLVIISIYIIQAFSVFVHFYLLAIFLVRILSIYFQPFIDGLNEKKIIKIGRKIIAVTSILLSILELSLMTNVKSTSLFIIVFDDDLDQQPSSSIVCLWLFVISIIVGTVNQVLVEQNASIAVKKDDRATWLLYSGSLILLIILANTSTKVDSIHTRIFIQTGFANLFLIKFMASNANLKQHFISRYFSASFINVIE